MNGWPACPNSLQVCPKGPRIFEYVGPRNLVKEKLIYPCGHPRRLSMTDTGEAWFHRRDVRQGRNYLPREFEKWPKSHSIRQTTTQKLRKSPGQQSTASPLRTLSCKYLFQFVIQILIFFCNPSLGCLWLNRWEKNCIVFSTALLALTYINFVPVPHTTGTQMNFPKRNLI